MKYEGYRSLFLDLTDGSTEGPRRRDVVVSIGKKGIGTVYLVLKSRRVQRRDPQAVPRFSMVVKVLPKDAVELPNPKRRVFQLHWYPRRKKTLEDYLRRKVQP